MPDLRLTEEAFPSGAAAAEIAEEVVEEVELGEPVEVPEVEAEGDEPTAELNEAFDADEPSAEDESSAEAQELAEVTAQADETEQTES